MKKREGADAFSIALRFGMTVKGPIALGTIRTSIVLGGRLLVQAGTLLLVARLLGPDQFGAFAGIAAFAVILGSLSTFGTHLVLLGEVSRNPLGRVAVLPYAMPCTLLCGGLLLAVYLAASACLLNVEGVPSFVLLAIGIAEIALQPFFSLMTSEHHGLGRVARAQLMQLMPMVLRLAVAGLIFVMQPPQPLATYAIGYVAASVIALVCGAFMLPVRWPSWRCWRIPDRRDLVNACGYAAINITRNSPAELDKTLALKLLPLGAVGLYAAAARVIGAATLPIAAMTLSALPRLFREGRDGRRTGHLVGWMYGSALVYGVLLAGGLWLVAPLFDGVFGSQYLGVGEVIRWLCLAVPGMTLRQVAGNVLMALGRPWMRVGFEATGLVILAFSSVVLTGWLGEIGLPLAVASAEWAMVVIGSGMLVNIRYALGRNKGVERE